MKKNETIILAVILAWLFWPKRSTEVTLYQTCVYPDGASVDVPLGNACPYDAAHGGQSVLEPYQ